MCVWKLEWLEIKNNSREVICDGRKRTQTNCKCLSPQVCCHFKDGIVMGGTSLTMGCQSPARLTGFMVVIVYSKNKQHSTWMELSIVIARGSTSFCSCRYDMWANFCVLVNVGGRCVCVCSCTCVCLCVLLSEQGLWLSLALCSKLRAQQVASPHLITGRKMIWKIQEESSEIGLTVLTVEWRPSSVYCLCKQTSRNAGVIQGRQPWWSCSPWESGSTWADHPPLSLTGLNPPPPLERAGLAFLFSLSLARFLVRFASPRI